MSALYNKKGGYQPPTSEDLFGVNDLTKEQKIKDWKKRVKRFYTLHKGKSESSKERT